MTTGSRAATSEEQLLYARILATGMYTGLGLLLVTFALYISGLVDPAVPIEKLPDYWSLSAHEYLEVVNAEHVHREGTLTGWWWLTALNRSDYLTFVGIVLLALVTIVCFLGIIPTLVRKRDYLYAAMAAVEVLILTLAASGILAVGH